MKDSIRESFTVKWWVSPRKAALKDKKVNYLINKSDESGFFSYHAGFKESLFMHPCIVKLAEQTVARFISLKDFFPFAATFSKRTTTAERLICAFRKIPKNFFFDFGETLAPGGEDFSS